MKLPTVPKLSRYLGHFAKASIFRAGHNTGPTPPRAVPGARRPTRRSDTPILDESLRKEEAERFWEDQQMRIPELTPEDIIKRKKRKTFIET